VPFRIAQSCGIKDSSHFVKIILFGAEIQSSWSDR